MKKRLTAAIAAIAAATLFALPAPAGAAECDGPTGDQYCPETQVLTGGGSGTATDPSGGGGLPFTGLDLGITLVAGAGLLGAGFALRRVSRHEGPSA